MKKQITLFAFCFVALFVSAQNDAPAANTDGTLTVTSNVGYSQPYYYAVWIKGTTGTFLRTITMYGQTSKYYKDLVHWNSESATNKVNATTGATRSASGPYSSIWNSKDQANSAIVVDGTYTVSIEMSSEAYSTNSKYITTTFTKGPAAVTLTPTGVSPISNISIKWQPINTALNDVKLSTLYSIYPNPAQKSVYVNGPDIQSIEVVGLNGAQLLYSNNQLLNTSSLAKGVYMLNITTGKGLVSKKLIKN